MLDSLPTNKIRSPRKLSSPEHGLTVDGSSENGPAQGVLAEGPIADDFVGEPTGDVFVGKFVGTAMSDSGI